MVSIKDIFRSYAVFDIEGHHVNGTDKESNHSYGDAYESLFLDRGAVQLMMEIGIADGSSLCAWRDVFPNALCVGLDAHESVKAVGDRLEFHLGDQRSRADCERAAAGRQFDFICEDATHRLSDTLTTLFLMWPYIKPGGLYIVEEWEGASGDSARIKSLFPNASILGTCGPHIQDEPLIVFRKPL